MSSYNDVDMAVSDSSPEISIQRHEQSSPYDDVSDIGFLSFNSGHLKSRRVDPERLAHRLHPDLVLAMEVYIAQGSRMPPFEVRKELQERFKVDRRHVYDYFHSRGMRVAKEDKHRNLSRRRIQAQLNKKSQEPCAKATALMSDSENVSSPALSSASKVKLPSLIIRSAGVARNPSSLPTSKDTPSLDPALEILPEPACQPSARKKAFKRFPKKKKLHRIPEKSHLDDRACSDLYPALESEPEKSACPIIEDQNLGLDDMGAPLELPPPEPCAEEVFHLCTEFEEGLDYSLWDSNLDIRDETARLSLSMGLELAHDYSLDNNLLFRAPKSPRSERLAIYDFIDKNIGSDKYTSESVGSYKGYMQERNRLYWARLLPPRAASKDGEHPIATIQSVTSAACDRQDRRKEGPCRSEHTIDPTSGSHKQHKSELPNFASVSYAQTIQSKSWWENMVLPTTVEGWTKLLSASADAACTSYPSVIARAPPDCGPHAAEHIESCLNATTHACRVTSAMTSTEPSESKAGTDLNSHLSSLYKSFPFLLPSAISTQTDLGAHKLMSLPPTSCSAFGAKATAVPQGAYLA